MNFFESHFNVRLTKDIEKRITKVILQNEDLYQSKAHFVRCAINQLLKNEEAKNEHTTTTRRVQTYVSTNPSFKRQNERLRARV